MLNGPHQKFCEGIVSGLNHGDAYAAAYPSAKRNSAAANATRLLKKDEIQAEIARIRAAAEREAGSAVLTLAEKRKFMARLVRTNLSLLDMEKDGDLLQEISDTEHGKKVKLASKLDAVKLDNDLAGEGSEAKGNEGLAALMVRLRK